ncbi:hypothetical protein [Nostoc sp.]|uniref:hypothetical protein n=1 Tax=Nostoc sp. TaxID=1180 RepID=UPI002FF75C54
MDDTFYQSTLLPLCQCVSPREDTGEKLLIPEELAEALKQERLAREQAQSQVERLKEHLRSLGVDPDTI